MRTVLQPNEIDDIANLQRSLAVRGTAQILDPYREAIVDSYDRYTLEAPELGDYRGAQMEVSQKQCMLKIYKRTNNGNLRHLRQALKQNCRRCPYCNISTASDLDHFLSKDVYPCLAIYSWNLVPICAECNRLKNGGAEGAFIHSYYDTLPRASFLVAHVVLDHRLVIIHFSLDLRGVENRLAARVRAHFETLDLANRYALEAQEKISAFRLSLPIVHDHGGSEAVRAELELRLAEAAFYGVNYWERAMLSALMASEDYCDGGFSGI